MFIFELLKTLSLVALWPVCSIQTLKTWLVFVALQHYMLRRTKFNSFLQNNLK